MKPDLHATLVATTLVHLVLAAAMFAAHVIYRKQIPGTRYWFAAAAATAAGHGFYAFAPLLPDFLSFSLPNALLATGVISSAAGAAALSGRSVSKRLFAATETAAVALFVAFGLIAPLFYVRSVIITAISIAGAGTAAAFLIFPQKKEDRAVTAVGGIIFALFSAISVGRIIVLLNTAPVQGGMDTPAWYVLFVNATLALYAALGVSFYLMVGGLLNRRLERSLRENTLLLTEIRHRTKNNLALIGSLISLQSDGMADPVAKSAFKDLSERLRTITTMYRMLSRVEDGHSADVKRYLDALAAGIRDSIIAGRRKIDFAVTAASCLLDTKQLVSLGLIVNELATNALKYAFSDERRGSLRLDFQAGEESCVLSFSDDGCGFAYGEKASEGLGLTLVRSLARELRGDLRIVSDRGKGTSYTLRFPTR